MYLNDRIYLSLFAGPNGFGAGLQYAGWHVADCIEWDRSACATIRANFTGMRIINKDIREQMVSELSHSYYPLAVYTWPCTRYSDIGKIHDIQKGDDLYLHAIRNHALIWPEVAIVENVLGMRKFPVVMELLRRYRGYHKTEFTVYGHDFTLQQKARCFLILHRQSFRFPSLDNFPQKHQIPIPGYLQARPGRKLRDYLDGPEGDFDEQPFFETRLNGGYQRPPQIFYPDQTDPIALQTNYKRDRSVAMVYDERMRLKHRPFTVSELARLHGYPEGYIFCGNKNDRYKQVIDSVMPPVAYALGVLVNTYFEHIQDLASPPEDNTYTFIQSVDPRRKKIEQESEYTSVPPVMTEPVPNAKQLSLFS